MNYHRTLRLPGCWPLYLAVGSNGQTNHGPQSRPRLAAVRLVRLHGTAAGRGKSGPDSGGRRLWLYFRGGRAVHVDVMASGAWERREFPLGAAAGRFARDPQWDGRCPIPLDPAPANG